ncbi:MULTISPECIES: hypothetical protein [unclassified Devosia]|uniref:hypothetical protein n=1 Tax=unclassified Devosia TaxID=196773 RepID=UPI000712F249|nr:MULTISPECIES: hypothetical protein [unclassified Devosia]KQU92899.1 hypothetical protein ASC68_24010 [Devosia sp. Root105]
MSNALLLHFRVPDGDDPELLRGRLVTFQSSLYSWLRQTGWGTVDWAELDKLEPTFSVRDVKSAKRKRVRDWIEKEVEAHGLVVQIEDGQASLRGPSLPHPRA